MPPLIPQYHPPPPLQQRVDSVHLGGEVHDVPGHLGGEVHDIPGHLGGEVHDVPVHHYEDVTPNKEHEYDEKLYDVVEALPSGKKMNC